MHLSDLLGRPLNDIESRYESRLIHCMGSMEIPLPSPRVSIIGSRKATKGGLLEAEKIARILIQNNVIITSGLARGIDTVAHETAIKHGGRTIAVLGTPLNHTYPKENSDLQETIMKNHLAISQYPENHPIAPKNFVLRNHTMALISNATVIVEAGDASGALHQGWESLRLKRLLFICKDMMENPSLEWPKKMIKCGAVGLSDPADILKVLPPILK